ncbi:MAG: primosomal protein N', partial [Actinoallomurus sp.]
MSLPHLDRPFDYLVPTTLDVAAVPGCRVRVRFAGQLVDGFLLERAEQSDHEGRLAYLERVTSSEPVLAPEIAALAREIADRYAGTLADVLRLAIPPRHARVEAENPDSPSSTKMVEEDDEAGEEAGVTEVAAEAGSQLDGARSTDGTETPPAREPVTGGESTAEETAAVADEPIEGAPADENAGRERHDGSRSDGVKETSAAGPEAAPDAEESPEHENVGESGALPGRRRTKAGTASLDPADAEEPEPPDSGQVARDAAPGSLADAPEEPARVRVADGYGVIPGERLATSSTPEGMAEGHAAASDDDAGVSDGPPRPSGGHGPVSGGAGAASGGGDAGASGGQGGVSEVRGAASQGQGVVSGEHGAVAGGHAAGAEERGVVADARGAVSGRRAGGDVGSPPVSGGQVTSVPGGSVEVGPWEAYPAGAAFLGALQDRRAPRAVWSALPGGDWTVEVARAASATLAGGRGVLIVVADGRDVARVDAALVGELGAGRHVALTAELGPAERYRRWLAVRRGRVAVVVGTRAAIFAPVKDLGLVVLWDDGDDVHAEPHAPYPHAREVLALRAHRAKAGALIGGFTRTTDATQLVVAGWAHPLVPDRGRLRGSMAYIRPSGDDVELARDEAARSARLPHVAFRAARQGLEHGPVLVQVPRRGYVPALACSRCRGPARCSECEGPLSLRSSHAAPYCRWCGRIAGAWACPECGGRQVRAVVVGARRTAEELGRAFPGIPVRTSGRDGVLADVTGEPALVVATPGAEPVAEGGYAAALLLDGWVLLGRADLRAGEEALRRWMNAAALVRPRGPVIVLADGSLTPVQALIRWDPV